MLGGVESVLKEICGILNAAQNWEQRSKNALKEK